MQLRQWITLGSTRLKNVTLNKLNEEATTKNTQVIQGQRYTQVAYFKKYL